MALPQRKQIVEQYAIDIKQAFPEIASYNILFFGSFLTTRYTSESDIDIGIFSLQPGLTFRLYTYTKDYFDKLGLLSRFTDTVYKRNVGSIWQLSSEKSFR